MDAIEPPPMSTSTPCRRHPYWLLDRAYTGIALIPGVFVLLWSTGFIGAKLGTPYAPPFTFLLLRFVVVAATLLAATLLVRSPWPNRAEIVRIAVVGLLVHGGYLAGVFVAISLG